MQITCRDQTSDQFPPVSKWRGAHHGGTSINITHETVMYNASSGELLGSCDIMKISL